MLYEHEEEHEADEPADEGDESKEESFGGTDAVGLGVVDHLAGGHADVVVLLAPVPDKKEIGFSIFFLFFTAKIIETAPITYL